MKAMLVAIFRAMQRKRLGKPAEPVSIPTLRTNNVVQMDRRHAGTATGRVKSARPATSNIPKPSTMRQTEESYDWAKRACESAWPQPSFVAEVAEDRTNHVQNFHGSGGSFDGGGSSGDWSDPSDIIPSGSD